MNITIDIETIPCQAPTMIAALRADADAELAAALLAVKAPSNYKDESKIFEFIATTQAKMREEHEAKAQEQYLRTSFDGGLGQVCVIGVAIDNLEPLMFQAGDASLIQERYLLQSFFTQMANMAVITRGTRPMLIGHNHIAFDLPFLWKRAIVHGIRPPLWFPRDPKPWGDSTFDTMTAWAGARERISMNKLCRILGIEDKGDMDGSKVWPMVQAGRIAEVVDYCRGDVERTRAIYRRMTFEPIVELEDIPA